jgi:hypothetical protein
MREFAAAGDDVIWVAFPPGGGNRWSIVAKSGAYFNRNIPNECHQKMHDLSQNGAKIIRVAFPPQHIFTQNVYAGETCATMWE